MAEKHVQIISDLHLESPSAYGLYNIEAKAPHLALLGDVGYIKDDDFFNFIHRHLEIFRTVFLILGNHEPYYTSWNAAKSRIKQFEMGLATNGRGETLGQFVFLDKTRYDLSSTLSVLGCTLFSQITPEQKENVAFGLNDFYNIIDWSVQAHQEAHRADLRWLNSEIDSISRLEPNRKVVVLTHYCPLISDEVVDPRHRDSKISSGFMTDLSRECCWNSSVVKVWAFGHTHFNCDFRDCNHDKRIVSNQRGYYSSQAASFDITKVIKI